MAILQLSPGMINKIAAGEVIERPASVVKELAENALDAGATRIEIEIEAAGNDRIAVTDNGGGIVSSELILALSPHATSKIASTDDLFDIRSFGFRGEALASIAEISRMTLKSRTADSPEGASVLVENGRYEGPVPCGMAVGTSVEVRHLFYNTPVRRKYLKSQNTEFGHLSEAVIRLAIPNPEVHFLLRHNGKTVYDLPPCQTVGERIGRIFGSETAGKLIPVKSSKNGLRVWGCVGHPDLSRANGAMQYFFLNRRFIRDKSLQHALTQGYRGLLTVGRFPVAFLMIEIDPNQVDVNVHPTKLEVRFLDGQRVYAEFLAAVREEFLRHDLRSRPAAGEDETSEDRAGIDSGPSGALDADSLEAVHRQTLQWAKGDTPKSEEPQSARAVFSIGSAGGGRIAPFRPYPSAGRSGPFSSVPSVNRPTQAEAPFPPFETIEPAAKPELLVLQIKQRYLVYETEEGMAVVDQHALHERVLYEKIRRQMANAPLDSQRLLIPETVDLSPVEAARALEFQELFARFGLTVEAFGGHTIMITGYPSILERLAPSEILTTLLAVVEQKGTAAERSDLLDSMMHQTACKAAVKAGERLGGESMAELLALSEEERRTDHCPHGRPTTLLFSVAEIDKMFKRT